MYSFLRKIQMVWIYRVFMKFFVLQLILCLTPRKLSIFVSIFNIYHSYKETNSIRSSVHFQESL